MNVYLFAAVILLLPALCTALGAAGVFLVRRADEPRTRRMLCGMAAGIMLAASVWSLLLPAIERAEAGILPVWLAPAAGLVLAAFAKGQSAAGSRANSGTMMRGRAAVSVRPRRDTIAIILSERFPYFSTICPMCKTAALFCLHLRILYGKITK